MAMEIMGVYSSQKIERHESGRAPVGRLSKVYWFVVRKNSDYFALQQLDDQMLPSRVAKNVNKKEFSARYTPEPIMHKDYILPYLVSLKARLEVQEGKPDAVELSNEQRQIYNGLLQLHSGSASGGHRSQTKLVVGMLSEISPDETDFVAVQSRRINRLGMDLRKAKNYDGAINYYQKAIEISPYDDHLLFNMARAYYEKGDERLCRDNLDSALRMNPGLRVAERFIRHLDQTGRAVFRRR